MKQQVRVIAYVKSHYDKSNPNYEFELASQMNSIFKKIEETDAALIAIYGDRDIFGNPVETTLDQAIEAIKNGDAKVLMAAEAGVFTPKGMRRELPFEEILRQLTEVLKNADATVEVVHGRTVQSIIFGTLAPIPPNHKVPDH
ncbi:hypothetical protein EON83_00200 [bacterium]|nr:MAG: hypothetical protein EON83_00200 [bacterium]